MSTRTIQIYPSERCPRIDQLHGNGPVRFRVYEVLVAALKSAIVDEREEQTCVITHTADGPLAHYEHTLSELEVAQEVAQNATARLTRGRALLPREGEPMSAEMTAALRAALAA